MPFEINNVKIGFTTNFYKKKNLILKKNLLKKKKTLESLTLVPFSCLKAVTMLA